VDENPLDVLAREDAARLQDLSGPSSPVVRWIAPTEHHVQAMRSLLAPVHRGGRLVNDAHLAARAIEHGGTIYSQDTDFAAFPGVRWVNPLA
jgi:predicted nucleic acid-binding protein